MLNLYSVWNIINVKTLHSFYCYHSHIKNKIITKNNLEFKANPPKSLLLHFYLEKIPLIEYGLIKSQTITSKPASTWPPKIGYSPGRMIGWINGVVQRRTADVDS